MAEQLDSIDPQKNAEALRDRCGILDLERVVAIPALIWGQAINWGAREVGARFELVQAKEILSLYISGILGECTWPPGLVKIFGLRRGRQLQHFAEQSLRVGQLLSQMGLSCEKLNCAGNYKF